MLPDFSSSFNSQPYSYQAWAMAWLSELAYQNPAVACATVSQLGLTGRFFSRRGTQAYVFTNDKILVVVCRGTQPLELDDLRQDLKVWLVKDVTTGRVHRGFNLSVRRIWSDIKSYLVRNMEGKVVYFTGHSMGAALSTIMAIRAMRRQEVPNSTVVYTFGSPRIGDRNFVDLSNLPHYRFVNNSDIITRVPVEFSGYKHHGQEYYFNHYGDLREVTGWQKAKDIFRGILKGIKNRKYDSFADHAITEYIHHLDLLHRGIPAERPVHNYRLLNFIRRPWLK